MSATPDNLTAARMAQAVALRVEFRRRHFNEREHLLLGWILDFSLMCGREDMTAPTLESLGQLAHMSKGNVCTCVKALELMRVLTVTREGDVSRYRLNPDTEQWSCRPRLSRDELRFALANLREANGFKTDFFVKQTEAAASFQPLSLDVVFPKSVPTSGTVPQK